VAEGGRRGGDADLVCDLLEARRLPPGGVLEFPDETQNLNLTSGGRRLIAHGAGL
jgi:hypothetical protein